MGLTFTTGNFNYGKGSLMLDVPTYCHILFYYLPSLSVCLSVGLPARWPVQYFPNKLRAAQAPFSPHNMLFLTLSVLYTGLLG